MKSSRRVWLALAALTSLGLVGSAHAGTISNFNQNPQGPGFGMTGTAFTPTAMPIDYTFQTPPGNTGVYSTTGSPTIPGLLTITSGGLVGGTASTDGFGNLIQAVNFNFTITVVPPTAGTGTGASSLANGTNLLSGNLVGTITLSNTSQVATFNMVGVGWNSAAGVLYQGAPGSPLVPAQFLYNYTSSWALNGVTPTTIIGGNIQPFTGTSMAGSFSAVPEPASVVLMGLGVVAVPGALWLRRKRLARA